MSTLFISDLHLDASRPAATETFFEFLAGQARAATDLYILGDLFDYWVGDDYSDTEVVRVKQLLCELQTQHVTCYFIHGNRDFLLGEHFARETGIQLLPEESRIKLKHQPAIITHGDQLCTRDTAHQQFRAMTQSASWRQQMLARPLAERIQLAEQIRQISKANYSNTAEDIMDVTPEAVQTLMQRHQVPLLIHGHTHRPAVHTLHCHHQPAKRIVLGDWGAKGWYLTDAQDQLELQSFVIAR